jgi:hypothetical protein
MIFFPEEYDVGELPSALNRLGVGQLNTQRADFKLYLNSKEGMFFCSGRIVI